MYLFSTIDVVHTRMKIYTRIKIPVYKLIHVRNYTCLKPYTCCKSYAYEIIHVTNHTRYKSYAYEMTPFDWTISDTPLPCKSYAYEIIHVTNLTRCKSHAYEMKAYFGRYATHPCPVLLSPRVASRRVRSSVAKRVFYNMFAVHCFSSVHCTQCIVQYNAL